MGLPKRHLSARTSGAWLCTPVTESPLNGTVLRGGTPCVPSVRWFCPTAGEPKIQRFAGLRGHRLLQVPCTIVWVRRTAQFRTASAVPHPQPPRASFRSLPVNSHITACGCAGTIVAAASRTGTSVRSTRSAKGSALGSRARFVSMIKGRYALGYHHQRTARRDTWRRESATRTIETLRRPDR